MTISRGQVRVLDQLFPVLALDAIDLETLSQELHALNGEINVPWNSVDSFFQIEFELLHVLTSERVLACQHLKQNCAQTPHVGFVVVFLLVNYFGRHGQRGACKGISHLSFVVERLCQTHVAELERVVADFRSSRAFLLVDHDIV